MKLQRVYRQDTVDIREAVRHFDIGEIQGSVTHTDEGYLKADAAVTRIGVFKYLNPDGTTRHELRHPDDVFRSDSLDTLKMKPITKNHPSKVFVDAENAKEFAVGLSGETVRPNGKFIMSTLLITHEDGIKAVEKEGMKEISCGYHADLLPEDGTFQGQKYDCRQVNIRYNHIALVKRGRAGAEVRLNVDHADNAEADYSILELDVKKKDKSTKQPSKRGERMFTIRLDNGCDYEVESQEVAQAFKAHSDELKDMKKKLDEKETEISTLKADRDTHKENADKLQKKIDGQGEEITKAVADRISLEREASVCLDEETVKKIDGMTDKEIRCAVIQAKFPEAKLDEEDVTDAYISARYDAAIELFKAEGAGKDRRKDAMSNQRKKVVTKRVDHKDDDKGLDAAEKRHRDALENAWQPKKD